MGYVTMANMNCVEPEQFDPAFLLKKVAERQAKWREFVLQDMMSMLHGASLLPMPAEHHLALLRSIGNDGPVMAAGPRTSALARAEAHGHLLSEWTMALHRNTESFIPHYL